MAGYRFDQGGLVDRSAPLHFVWAGRRYQGVRGDTLASALLANGVSLVGRSFKYHRPRGIIAGGLDEPNAIVQLEADSAYSTPNLKATYVDLYEALRADPVNARPSVEHDAMAVNGLFKRFIPAAFYYKTFMWPNWRLFEQAIRKAAGLGVSPSQSDPDRYDQRHAHCDVLVVGGGVAGLKAALTEGQAGRSVMLVTGGAHWGGRLAGSRQEIEERPAGQWIAAVLAELKAMPNVSIRSRTLATGYYDHGLIALCERLTDHLAIADRRGPRQRLWKLRAGRVVLATGAIERPLVFPRNDVPGVMLANAALAYLRRFGVVVGREAVVATNNDSAWLAAFGLAEAGVKIAAIADARAEVDSPLIDRAAQLGIAVHLSAVPVDVRGSKRVSAVTLAPLGEDGRAGASIHRLKADTLLMSGGWSPVVHLHSQAGGGVSFDETIQAFVPSEAVQAHRSVGAAAGDFDLSSTLASAAGGAAAPARQTVRPVWSISQDAAPSGYAWIDYQNDVTAADVALAARENFVSVEHLKRYTTLGMASDQGKTSNVNGIGVMSELLGRPPAAIGTTRFRPPYDPTTIGVFAGHRVGAGLQPVRHLAARASHEALGARMEDYGGWTRPSTYRQDDESEDEAIAREVRAVRGGVGLFEASPLGKIEVKGPDAARFLDRVYVNKILTMKPGKCRYGLMLNENGVVYDDGIVTRLADDHFLVGATSGHASSVAEMLQEWLQCEWVDLKVLTEDVTTSWAVVNVAGPQARRLLERLGGDIDLSAEAFPHMSHFEGRIADIACRIARVSFSGELSYEVAVPWDQGARLWALCLEEGRDLGVTPFGIESLMAMRIEKGFLHVGSDTDGMTLPQDIGFGTMIAGKKSDFIGRRSTTRPDGRRPDRRQFVGLDVIDGGEALTVGAHVVAQSGDTKGLSEGWVTSSVWSPTLDSPVALAMIQRGTERHGETVTVWDLGQERRARIGQPCRYDSAGDSLNG